MVSPGSDKITLELIVDKEELERQVGEVFQAQRPAGATAGAGAGTGAGIFGTGADVGAGGRPTAPVRVNPAAGMLKALGPLAALAGISLTLTGILKQSKVMAATAGAVSSLIGAMVDSFLAPLVVELLPSLLSFLRKGIPLAREAGQKSAETVSDLKGLLGGDRTVRDRRAGAAGLLETGADIYGAVGKMPSWMRALPGMGVAGMVAKPIEGVLDRLAGVVDPGSQKFGGRPVSEGTLLALQRMNDAKLTRFVELSASRPGGITFNIDGLNNEEILIEIRRELDGLTGSANRGIP